MKKFFTLALATALLVLSQSCFRQEVQSAEYHIPEMATPAAAQYIQNHIKGIPGITGSTPDIEARIMEVSYQSSTIRTMNIEEAIALSVFKVNDRPANPKAKLPEGLK
jgi:hypothetical protein